MKHLIFSILLLGAGSLAAQNPWDGLKRLVGAWEIVASPQYTTVEKWEAAAPDTLHAVNYRLYPDGEKVLQEHLHLVRGADGSIAYQATVLNQNDGATIAFPLVFFTATSWTFENLEHDFPQTIEYRFQDDETLVATISGGGKEFSFLCHRMPNDPDSRAKPTTLRGYDLFVSSHQTGTVERYDAFTGEYKGAIGKAALGGPVQDLTLGPDGLLYVTALNARSVLRFQPATGAFLGPFTTGFDLQNPTNLAFGPDGFLYVSQWGEGQGQVLRFDVATGRFDREIVGSLSGPRGCTWDAAGNLYVACQHGKEVRRVPVGGGSSSAVTPPGSLQGPAAVWLAPNGDLLVADLDHTSIKRFRQAGATWAYAGPFADGFGRLDGVALGPDGFLYAADFRLNMVKKLEADTGVVLGIYLEGGGMQGPNGLAFWRRP